MKTQHICYRTPQGAGTRRVGVSKTEQENLAALRTHFENRFVAQSELPQLFSLLLRYFFATSSNQSREKIALLPQLGLDFHKNEAFYIFNPLIFRT